MKATPEKDLYPHEEALKDAARHERAANQRLARERKAALAEKYDWLADWEFVADIINVGAKDGLICEECRERFRIGDRIMRSKEKAGGFWRRFHEACWPDLA